MYQILINKESKPVLIEILKYEKTISFIEGSSKDITEEFNQTIIQQSISDESKHIQFKDGEAIWNIIFPNNDEAVPDNHRNRTFSIPEGYIVRFEYQVASVHHKDIWGTISEDYYNTLIDTKYPSELRKLAILIKI